MGKPHTSEEFTSQQIEQIAGQLQLFAQRYLVVVEEMKRSSIQSLPILHKSHAAIGLEKLRKHVFQAERALSEHHAQQLFQKAGQSSGVAAEIPELYITPVGKNSSIPTPTRKKYESKIEAKPASKTEPPTKKKAE